jgi:hypothetical protein
MRIGLIGVGRIGTVHSRTLRGLARSYVASGGQSVP